MLSAVEPCRSYEVRRNPETKTLDWEAQPRKCRHWYVYFLDAVLGRCPVRIQSWLPFTVPVCVNGRDRLCRELTRQGIGFERRDNCLARVDDVAAAQQILDSQPWAAWSTRLDELVPRACPPLWEIPGFLGRPHEFFLPAIKIETLDDVFSHEVQVSSQSSAKNWSADETEWASDVMFRSNAALYPSLIRHGMTTFSSREVLRFLGKVRIPPSGVDVRFNGEVVTRRLIRPEGVCLKHRLNRNTLKMYDQQGSVLRVETTINDPSDFGVHRATENNPTGPKNWRKLRKGVVDWGTLWVRRAAVSQAANTRYLTALAAVDCQTPLGTLVDQLAQPLVTKTSRARGLHPLTGVDAQLVTILLRGEFALHGFRNRDLRETLFPPPDAPSRDKTSTDHKPSAADAATLAARRRQSGQVTRWLRLFRAHGLIRKIPRTHRDQLTAH